MNPLLALGLMLVGSALLVVGALALVLQWAGQAAAVTLIVAGSLIEAVALLLYLQAKRGAGRRTGRR